MNPIDDIVTLALAEDACFNDITSRALLPDQLRADAKMVAKQRLVLSGSVAVVHVFQSVDPSIRVQFVKDDGDTAEANEVLANISGPTRAILAGERVALNFLQQLSGVATLTRAYCDAISGTNARIVDTRKTVPGMRVLQKQAVIHGGGTNHRMSLADGILIKDNHIAAAGSVHKAVTSAKRSASAHHLLRIEIEVENLAQLNEALAAGADAVLLDNMSSKMTAEAVRIINGAATVEASGNISLENVREIAACGVNIISIGKLTHSAPSCDISMDFVKPGSG
ncbi:carboxylating nicotinate-nucleotide diphosphorylase [bacterium]|nr:carboxylating nicotinate-nucleotide diphosphorylase [bacterium]